MYDFIIELSTCGSVTVCTNEGDYIWAETDDYGDAWIYDDFLDCNATGDCEDACRYMIENYRIDWRIVKKVDGEYANVTATAEDKQEVAKSIYFDSDNDFSDETWAEVYLIWQAACDVEQEFQEYESSLD